MTWPDADVVVDKEVVESLIDEQFPHLANEPLKFIAQGFDNVLWRVGENCVARLPRRVSSVENLVNEGRWLPEIVATASLTTSAPLLYGRANARFPWPWLISRWQAGVPGDQIPIDIRSHSASTLATFLRSIHRTPPHDAPYNPYRSTTLLERDDDVHARCSELDSLIDSRAVRRTWEYVITTTSTTFARSWIHGDLHPGNTIFNGDTLTGVIDFGDLCAGDVATDLAGGLLSFDLDGAKIFLDAYGVNDDLLHRTVGWALHFGLLFVSLGREHPPYASIGRVALENACELSHTS